MDEAINTTPTEAEVGEQPTPVVIPEPTPTTTEIPPVATVPAATVPAATVPVESVIRTSQKRQTKTPFYKRLKARHYVMGGIGVAVVAGALALCTAHSVPASSTSVATSSAMIATGSATIAPTKSVAWVGCVAHIANSQDPYSEEPDASCTPGVADPNITQANIAQTICTSGYTTIVRSQKPTSYFETLKKEGVLAYGYTNRSLGVYEEDHLISLELGGTNDTQNLWPEFGASPNEKDKVENFLHAQVCSGKLPLKTAQKEIATDWYQVYTSFVR